MFIKNSAFIFLFFFSFNNIYGQEHQHHTADSSNHHVTAHIQHDLNLMSHAFSRNIAMSRNSSGTSWLPDNSPMYGYMKHVDNWMFMFHGNAFLRYNHQDLANSGSRGNSQFDIPNWLMGMGQRNIGNKGLFRFSAMISLEPLTIGGSGTPLLFQSGETWKGQPLVDYQHPHDFFSELSIAYSHMFSRDADAFIYLGYPGEPAFGPPAFMHRISGIYNPDAGLGHHWQDATHITFGVTTVGFRYKNFKFDASNFTGREPDEDRFIFDKPRFDSWSARISYNPTPAIAMQFSKAWVKDVHELGPREDINKMTASVLHSLKLRSDHYLNSAFVWGYNEPKNHHSSSHSFLFESTYSIVSTSIFGRYEWVQKSTEELLLESSFAHGELFSINSFTLGAQQRLFTSWKTNFSLGLQSSIFITPKVLEGVYGNNPFALQVYLRLSPALMH